MVLALNIQIGVFFGSSYPSPYLISASAMILSSLSEIPLTNGLDLFHLSHFFIIFL